VTGPQPAPDPIEQANQRIRDAAKWLIASTAAVGAALLAGSQLSSIGRLDVGWPATVATARLWVAVAGALLGLTAVVFVIWTGVRLLLPRFIPVADLAAAWDAPHGTMRPVVAFFRRQPKYLQGFDSPALLIDHRAGLVAQLAGGAAVGEKVADADRRITAVEDMANHRVLEAEFRSTLRRLLPATACVALGIVAFAWAANPAPRVVTADLRNARLVNATLRDADLRNARLDGADLTGADLTGAHLDGASLVAVVWRRTVCPDGTGSDEHGDTCAGHLSGG
jgi:Pentapeptide repeats (8 copies)